MSSFLLAFFLVPLATASEGLPELSDRRLESFAAGLRERVEQAYDLAVEEPESAQAAAHLGMLMHTHKQYDFAEACYQRARNLQPNAFPWAYYLGVVQSLAGKPDRAAASLSDALSLEKGYLPARLTLAEALFTIGNIEESEQLYREIVREYPDLATGHYGLGRIAAARGEPAQAVEHLLRACGLFNVFGSAHYALGLAYRDLGEQKKARQHFAIYQQHPTAWPPVEDPLLDAIRQLQGGALQHFNRGVQLAEKNQVAQSIEEHQKALALDPELPQAHLNLIILYGRAQNWAGAEQHYREIQKINPNLAEAHYNYAVTLSLQGRYADAVEALRKVLQINPFYAEAHNNLGYMLENNGDVEGAEKHYRQAVANDPSHRLSRFNLGRILVARERYEEAIEQFSKILGPEDENTPRFTYALAAAYVRAGKIKEGIRYAEEAKQKAEALGQKELVASIESGLEKLRGNVR